jgi:hypothetical protein
VKTEGRTGGGGVAGAVAESAGVDGIWFAGNERKSVVCEKFSKKTEHGKRLGEKKNHQPENKDDEPSETEDEGKRSCARANAGAV